MKPSLQELFNALQASWNADTAYDPSEWSIENKARGQCVVSSLVIQDYFGGDLIRYEVSEGSIHETHYMNQLPGGIVIDTTSSQYTSPVNMRLKPINTDEHASIRDKRLADESTKTRYAILKDRVKQYLASRP